MQKPLLYSLLLHLLLFILFMVGLPNWRKSNPDLLLPIPIDVVEIGAKTQAPKPTVQPKKEKPKPEEPKKEPPKKEEPKPQPKPEPKPAPEPEKPEPKPEPKAEPIAPAPTEKPKPPTPPKKVPEKKAPEKKPEKKKVNTFDSVLKNLEEIEKTVPDAVKDDKADDSKLDQQVGEIGDTLTISELDAIRRQLTLCWHPPAGAKGAQDMPIIPVRLFLNIDGSVREARLVEKGQMGDAFYRAVAESALRAVKDPQCNPLKLPPEKYETWKDMTINFNPKDLM
jgi:hypothetical protein